MLHLCFIILVFPSINISYIKYIKKSSLKNYTYSFFLFALCFHYFLLLFFSLLSLLCGVVVLIHVVFFTSRLSRIYHAYIVNLNFVLSFKKYREHLKSK